MVKTRTDKIASIEEEIKQLKERQKKLQQQHNAQERKNRTKRLCKRMGLFESMLPDTIPLTEEQFKAFLEKTVTTEHSRRILDELTTQTATMTMSKEVGAAAQGTIAPTRKPAGTAQQSDESMDENEDYGTRVSE